MKLVSVRWLDISKGDEANPEYRSRLVAQEIKTDKRQDLFAATPPLEAKKILCSLAVTEGVGYQEGYEHEGTPIDFIDVSRAFFHSDAIGRVFVKLPGEDHEEGMCGLLNKSSYGTRDAAQNWNASYTKFMADAGFRTGRASPCAFYHKDREIRVVVRGDDFACLGWN